MQIFSEADGSAYFEQGNTKVIASVHGPHEVCLPLVNASNYQILNYFMQIVDKSKAGHEHAVIRCEFAFAPFSTNERRKRVKSDRLSA